MIKEKLSKYLSKYIRIGNSRYLHIENIHISDHLYTLSGLGFEYDTYDALWSIVYSYVVTDTEDIDRCISKITVISKEEFNKAFNNMIDTMKIIQHIQYE